ncbi:kinase-like domain-containing protein [Suillus clintonianus]|uniref:kinase-like domain-containing protein n=1 Tax=Suillus clintonianus TaxID=1904413 RepID=UPI001B880F5E|nr:kinase-like domain-containing protein [Suillus clintonianus]KAG2143611.1 kinase-like domain-containing protein [Suillus clintonianus]
MRLPSIDTWWSPTDTQRHPELQSLPQDLLYAHVGPALDLPSTAISLPPKSPAVSQKKNNAQAMLMEHTATPFFVLQKKEKAAQAVLMEPTATPFVALQKKNKAAQAVLMEPTATPFFVLQKKKKAAQAVLMEPTATPFFVLQQNRSKVSLVGESSSQIPSARRSSPEIGSRIPQSYPHPREVLPSSAHTDTVLPVRNHESGESDHNPMLQNLTEYITKDGDWPVTRGGFGEIWKCTYSIDRRLIKVAVKSLQVYAADQLGPAKSKKTKRITRELRICANLKHENILPVYGYTYGFGPYIAIVSPWAENGSLTAYLERVGADLTLVRRFQILRDIIAGLQYLHVNSVIHGDFSGPNVLIHGDGTACVADFGLSLMYSEDKSASQASWTSTLKGNMRWMAPELLEDREDGSQVRPSEQSDMYSFGGIMHQQTVDFATILTLLTNPHNSAQGITDLTDITNK